MNKSRLPLLIAVVVAVIAIAVGIVVIRKGNEPAAAVTQLNCLGGSEKSALMADSEIQGILRDKYSLDVKFEKRGSYDLVQIPADTLRSQRIDCLWPSSASALSVFESAHNTGDFPGYRAESVLESPEVIYAGTAATEALVRTGIVIQRDNAYYIVDFKRLLLDYVLPKQKWDALGAQNPAGPIRISSTDPKSSNSGFALSQLELTVVASSDLYQPPTVAEAKAGLRTVRGLYDAQGLQSASSDGGFREWLIQGASTLFAGYENQILQQLTAYQDNPSATTDLTTRVRMLYPEPTLFNSNPVLTLTQASQPLIAALQDPQIQQIAWKRYGFRSATQLGSANAADFPQIPLATQPRTTTPPKADVTLLLLACLQDEKTCG
ncbi:hypothetical protein [Nocardia huaxiensis]|uniref:Extracellular solute-binding protein n=1 Tax=Nocardia huaxiensis TaxID=2755382 RepID=A0A7D6ZGR5_9NOCA|nr:hypothetical protein [Nocardia huaxiensis]QLY30007.1 hypothetical protein H0264_33220 [Nocardia huaxiensis]UFS96400.1 hypothetical protein LPY97_00170 [Nocardia huaxiensis]